MSSKLALESLKQRGVSPLFADLTSLYQISLDALYDSPGASCELTYNILKKMNYESKLLAIITKYMGPVVSAVKVTKEPIANMRARGRESHISPRLSKKSPITIGMIIERINNLYDDRFGKYTGDTLDSIGFYFIIEITAGMWMVRNKDNSFYFTPQELAAITLHELGHVDDYIRTLGRVRLRTQDASDILDYLSSNHDRDMILKLIQVLKSSPVLDNHWINILKITEKYFKESNSLDDPHYFENLSVISTIVASNTSSTNKYILEPSFDKHTNRRKTRLTNIDSERSADDFSVRHGAYSALTSGILKHYNLNDIYSPDSAIQIKLFTDNYPSILIKTMLQFESIFNISVEDIDGSYDPMIRRLELMVETAKHAFSDSNLPHDVVVDINNQINECEKYITQYKLPIHRQMRKTLFDWKVNMSKFGRILISPFHDRRNVDYEKLQNANRSISRHSLFYLSQK